MRPEYVSVQGGMALAPSLSRRSRRGHIPVDRMRRLIVRWLLSVRVYYALTLAPHGRHYLR